MNTFRITLTNGTTTDVRGESYIAGSAASALKVIDQFGATLYTYAAGTWTDIAAVSPSSADASGSTKPVITASDPNVPGTYLNSRSVTSEPNG